MYWWDDPDSGLELDLLGTTRASLSSGFDSGPVSGVGAEKLGDMSTGGLLWPSADEERAPRLRWWRGPRRRRRIRQRRRTETMPLV